MEGDTEMRKAPELRTLDDTFTCVCGAPPYDPERHPHGAVGLTRYRKSKYGSDGGYSIVCCRCGRVGERGRTVADAVARWDGHLYKYGPLKEETS